MIPAMMPPPMPVKLFEFAAGVFEMKPAVVLQRDLLGQVPAVSDLGDHYDYLRSDRFCTRLPGRCMSTSDMCLASQEFLSCAAGLCVA